MKHIFTILLSIILLGTSPVCALAQEVYAIVSPNDTTLTYYYDKKKASRQGTAYEFDKRVDEYDKSIRVDEDEPTMVIDSYGIVADNGMMGLESRRPRIELITTVIFDESFKNARPVSCSYWFGGFSSLTKIEGINNFNTSNKESRILYPIQIGIIASVLRPDEPNLPIQIDNQLRNYR